jgi:hypothetical protein
MTKDEKTEAQRCTEALRTSLATMPETLDRAIAFAAVSRLEIIVGGAHSSESHAGKVRRPRKKRGEATPPAAGGAPA